MNVLTSQAKEVLSVRDCPAVHALLLDVWQVYQAKGEREAMALLALVRAGVERYQAHERALRPIGVAPAGVVLGAKAPPGGGAWWALLDDGSVVPGGDKRAAGASHWCADGAGWWKAPATGAALESLAVRAGPVPLLFEEGE